MISQPALVTSRVKLVDLGLLMALGVVKLRNAIVHPKKTKRDVVLQTPVAARMEAHAPGLWYAEMALLHIFGYEGSYYQRFAEGGLGIIRPMFLGYERYTHLAHRSRRLRLMRQAHLMP